MITVICIAIIRELLSILIEKFNVRPAPIKVQAGYKEKDLRQLFREGVN
ncbi:MAG TPA: hypothetical protein VJ184_08920 [Chryseolinea sp.]|nr:hypothetical protein [Chryseolinea sp.]